MIKQFDSKIAIPALLAGHVLAGWIAGYMASEEVIARDFVRCLFVGLFFAQLTLLGFWSTLGLSKGSVRTGWSFVAVLYWVILFCVVVPDPTEVMAFFVVGCFVVLVLPLWVLSKWVARLEYQLTPGRAGTQFQIRHLLLLTLAISVLLAVGKWVPPGSLQRAEMPVILIVLVCASGTVGVAAVWAMLSKTSIWFPGLLLLGYALATGWFVDSRMDRASRPYYLTTTFAIDAALLLVSLGIVRLCGYRLISLRQQNASLTAACPGDDSSTDDKFKQDNALEKIFDPFG